MGVGNIVAEQMLQERFGPFWGSAKIIVIEKHRIATALSEVEFLGNMLITGIAHAMAKHGCYGAEVAVVRTSPGSLHRDNAQVEVVALFFASEQ